MLIVVAFSTVLTQLALSGCGASARERAIKTAFLATNAARDGFVMFDAQHQLEIVDKAQTKEEGAAALATWRSQRDSVVSLFVVTYYAISAAATFTDDPKTLASLLETAHRLKIALDALKAPAPKSVP
jgi:hypothetical protein